MAIPLLAMVSAGQAQFAPQAPELVPHGSSTRLPATNNVVTVSGDAGTSAGSNLLHSFSVFNIFAGGTVTYTSPTAPGPAVAHVVTRVTGGTSEITGAKFSLIQGTLTGVPGASFWFINPNGIIFGSGAILNGASAFHFSTADYIKLADGVSISANPAQGGVLTVAPPSAFGFLTANPAAITVGNTSGTILRPRLPVGPTNPAGTQSNPQGTLSLVGGTINIGPPEGTPGFAPGAKGPGFIHAHSRLNLASVASVGEATFDGRGFSVDAFPQLGDINIKQGSVVDSREVFIRGGRLTLDNGAIVPWVFRSLLPPGTVLDGGEVNINVSNEMIVRGRLVNGALPNLGFPAGVYTFSVPVNSEASMNEATASRAVPDINIRAGSVSLDGGTATTGAANIRSERFAPGAAADVVINTPLLEVRSGGFIAVNNFFAGPGGTLTINAQHVELSGDGSTAFTGIAGQSNFNGFFSAASATTARRDPRLTFADGATVNVNATGPGTLIVRQGAEISTDSFAFGRAGDINVQASDILLSRDGAATGAIASQSPIAGRSGDVNINATGRIAMSGGFKISATTGGTGDGGTVTVSAGESISIDGANTGIFSTTVRPPLSQLNTFAARVGFGNWATLLSQPGMPANADVPQVLSFLNGFRVGGVPITSVTDLTIGDAGKITVTTPQLNLSNGARIDNSTAWAGNAGEIVANVGSLSLTSGAQIRSQSGLVRLDTGVLEVGSGDAGEVTINASDPNTISISGAGSSISTSTFGAGDGGAIQITSAGQVVISDRGSVTADSFGTGLTGDINITAGSSIVMDGGTISTRATTSDGGNIKLTAPNIIKLDNSQITTSVESGSGGGGNISIDPQFVILNGSAITANAFGGPGGNITIVADNFLADASSVLQASSALSTPGTVQIVSPENNVAGDIAQLPRELVDASRLLSGACSARRTGAASSFVVAGRGGVPVDPDGYLPSFSASAAAFADAPAAAAGQGLALAMAGWDCWR